MKKNQLYKKYNEALDKFINEIKDRFGNDLLGIIVTGSLVKKRLSKNSDIDLFMLIRDHGKRIRGSRMINGIEIEYFMNPQKQISLDIEREASQAKKTTLNIFKDGQILFDHKGILSKFKSKSQEILGENDKMGAFQLFSFKYFIDDYLKDIEDNLEEKNYFAFEYNISLLLAHIIEGYCKLKGMPLTKPKYLKENLGRKNKKLIELVESLHNAKNDKQKITILRQLADYVLSLAGGPVKEEFEMESSTTY